MGEVAAPAGLVAIRLLGGFEVRIGDRPVDSDAWRLRKAKTLVKLLALAPGHRMHRSALLGALWPQRDIASATNNLHQALYVARRAMAAGPGGMFCLREDLVLLADGAGPWLDTEAFDAACGQARRTRDPADYRAASDLYRGDLLPEDGLEDWAEAPREAYRQRRLGLLVDYAQALLAQGEHASAVEVIGAAIAAAPFHEGAHRMLMAALAGAGRRYEALAAFDRLREALAAEYAADPEPATRGLYRDLLAAGNPGSDSAVSSSGPRPALAAAAGPPAEGPGVLAVPVEQTSFVGRRREIAEITAALGRTRLLTLTGPGGAGKTRLAYRVAAGSAARYPDGVHVVELAALSRPELVPQTLASVLALPLPETGAAEAALARQLADRRLLLVLDNCEHLLGACVRLVGELLRSCPAVVVLATSREPLRVGGELTWRTPSLALPDLRALPPLARLAELESVRLFVERARSAAPGFVLDEATAPAVAEICVRLDGMPLAVELAAARASALAPSQIAARLGDALAVLDRGSRSALTRQQTLSATLAWSVDLLAEQERTLFRRLAVFAGSMPLEAVEHVCGGDGLDVVDLLSRLVDKSLVQAERAGRTVRYRLLETLRQYAARLPAPPGELAALRRAHREWYARFAAAHDTEPATGVVNASPRAVEDEHDNLRSALSSGLIEDPALALRLAVSLWRFWLARGYFSEGSRWLSTALAAAPDRTSLRVQALMAAAAMGVRRGDPAEQPLALGTEAVGIAREVGDERALAATLPLAGLLTWVADGAWQRGAELIEEARSAALSADALDVAAGATHLLGVVALSRGDARYAQDRLTAALDLLEQVPAGVSPFFPVVTPGFFWELGRHGDPRLLFAETVALFRQVGAVQAAAYTRVNLAYAVRLQGDLRSAGALLQDSVEAFARLGDGPGLALGLSASANLARLAGSLRDAGVLLQRSLALRRGVGDQRGVGMSLVNLGVLAAAEGDLGRADGLLREALALFEEMEDGPGRWGTRLNLGLVLFDLGADDRARAVLRQWRDLPMPHWTFRARAWGLLTLATLERRAGNEAAAMRCTQEASRRFLALADAPGLAHLGEGAKPTLSLR